MATERLWLCHKGTDLRLMIGKRLASGYYIDDGIAQRLNEFYDDCFTKAPWDTPGEIDYFTLEHDGRRKVGEEIEE